MIAVTRSQEKNMKHKILGVRFNIIHNLMHCQKSSTNNRNLFQGNLF